MCRTSVDWQLLCVMYSNTAILLNDFVNLSGHDAVALADCNKMTLYEVTGQNNEKLLLQVRHSDVQTIIKGECPYAFFLNCYAHQCNLTMAQGASQTRELWEFCQRFINYN